MSALVIKTGMVIEQQIAQRYAAPGTLVLTGEYTATGLDAAVPQDCKAILSLGVCGGLAPAAEIGQAFIYDRIVTGLGNEQTFLCDVGWRKRLFSATRYYERGCWSTGQFNTANTIAQRSALYTTTNCWVIDDESFAVAQFAAKRGIACIGLRTVSDGAQNNLPPAVLNALNPDGTDNLWDVVQSLFTEPIDPVTKQLQITELLQTAANAKRSYDELETACIQVGPNFQWE